MSTQRERLRALTLAVGWSLLAASGALGQQGGSPLSGFVLSGYGTANYNSVVENDRFANDFSVSVSPIVLWALGHDFLFETELEIGLEDGETDVALEYAQIDFMGFEKVQFVVGKFLLPFGVFGERLHPTWINKLPSTPLLYGHAHGGVAEGALLPILSDVGAMLRFCQPLKGSWAFDLSLYVTQGPEAVTSEDAAGAGDHSDAVVPRIGASLAADPLHDGDGTAGAFDIPRVAFGRNFSDNNDNKMLGARLGLVGGAGFELYLSGFHAMYNEEDFLDIFGGNVSAEWRRGAFELRGEGAMVWQEFEQEEAFPTLKSPAYYVQASRRVGDFEPVVRWSHLLDAKVSGEVARDEIRQMAFGINYWLQASVPVKLAYELNLDGDERLLLQWAYGF